MSDIQKDREERQHVIEVLKQMRLDYEDFWEENDTEEIKAFNYAIASIETDLKYDLLYEETITENCIACKYDEIEESDGKHCKKCLAGDSQFEVDKEFVQPTTKNDAPDVYVGKIEPTTKNDLGVDCISRADAIHAVSEALERTFVEHEDIANKLIGKLPSVTPQEPRKGHWIDSEAVLVIGYSDTDNFMRLPACECSVCHKPHIRGYGMDYCPNCGAKMVESHESEEQK